MLIDVFLADAENESEDLVSKENQHSEDQEMQLPQEWTY